MKLHPDTTGLLPDVATQTTPRFGAPLDWVGMDGIDAPIRFDAGDGVAIVAAAKIGAFVNLVRPDVRGIHMSRLYLMVDQHLGARVLDAAALDELLRVFIDSHEGLADAARIEIRFDHLVRRRALRSDNSGWRAYPVTLEATRDADGFRFGLTTEVTYSSTCPASAALARQLIQARFAADFDRALPLDHDAVLHWLGSEQGIVATPHAQRSVARMNIRYAEGAPIGLIGLLDRVEQALGTPVQTAVKREDEQAFALANGGNLMFCEDAARRIQQTLDADPAITAFHVRLEHQESLHAHDAVAFASKQPR